MKADQQKTAFLMALAANIMWASSFVGSKYTLLVWAPYTAVLLRFALSFVALLASYKIFGIKTSRPQTKRQWVAIILVGLVLGALYPLQLGGLVYITSGTSAAIMLLAPLILVMLAPFVTTERIERQKIIAIALGVIGGLILLSNKLSFSKEASLGTWLTLGAAACLAVFTLLSRKFSSVVDHPTMTLYSFGVGAVVVAPFAFFEAHIATVSADIYSKSIFALIFLAVACTAIPFYIWNRATSMTETKNLASTMHAKTPVAILLGVLVFNETLTWQLAVGASIVTLALWISQTKYTFSNKKYNKEGVAHGRKQIVSAAIR